MKYNQQPVEMEKVCRGKLPHGYRYTAVMDRQGYIGIAVCSPQDMHNRKRGLAIARGRCHKAQDIHTGAVYPRVDQIKRSLLLLIQTLAFPENWETGWYDIGAYGER